MIDISIDISNDKWKVSSDPPSLKEGDVDLWRVDLDRVTTSGSPLLALLSDDEKQRAQR